MKRVARSARASVGPIPTCSPLFFRPAPVPEWIGSIIMAASTAEEHESHQANTDHKRKEGAKTKGDPAVRAHHGFTTRIPYGRGPNKGQDENSNQNDQQGNLSETETFHSFTVRKALVRRRSPLRPEDMGLRQG